MLPQPQVEQPEQPTEEPPEEEPKEEAEEKPDEAEKKEAGQPSLPDLEALVDAAADDLNRQGQGAL